MYIECWTIWWRRLVMKVILRWGRCTLNCELYSCWCFHSPYQMCMCARQLNIALSKYCSSMKSMQHSIYMYVCVYCTFFISLCTCAQIHVYFHPLHIARVYALVCFYVVCILIIQILCSFSITNLSRSFSFYYIHKHIRMLMTLYFLWLYAYKNRIHTKGKEGEREKAYMVLW